MARLADLVRAELAAEPDGALLELLFGTAEPDRVAESVETWVGDRLDGQIADAWLWRTSIGAVAGLRLEDRREVVVKAHHPSIAETKLLGQQRIQRRAYAAGLPAPQPIGVPAPLGLGRGTAETAIRRGRTPDARNSKDRQTMARGLAAFISSLRRMGAEVVALTPSLAEAPLRSLYPPPHSPRFDFEATAAGAEWIDDLARPARAVMDEDESRPTLVHTDWRPDNLRVARVGRHVSAIYDWDSVRVSREAVAIGQDASNHSIDWSGPGPPYYATAEECRSFALAVEAALSRSFSAAEHRVVRAAILYGWCYTARCEHAIDPTGDRHPSLGMRARLRSDAQHLL